MQAKNFDPSSMSLLEDELTLKQRLQAHRKNVESQILKQTSLELGIDSPELYLEKLKENQPLPSYKTVGKVEDNFPVSLQMFNLGIRGIDQQIATLERVKRTNSAI